MVTRRIKSDSTDKRSVHTDALDTLGTCPIPSTSARDAIHLAVEPVVAGCILRPGEPVGMLNNRAYSSRVFSKSVEPVGIVDPFIIGRVEPGQAFWLVLLPRTITSLRHVWTHPAFEGTTTTPELMTTEQAESWLTIFCRGNQDIPLWEELKRAIEMHDLELTGDSMFISGSQYSGDVTEEFWSYLEIATGRTFDIHPMRFRCGC